MTKTTLLFDLDDTLLDTNLDAFLSEYFRKLALHMSGKIPPGLFTKALLASTQIMYTSKQPDKTLERVFDDNFYPMLGFQKMDLANDIETFYNEVFPTLGSLTSPRKEAIELVEWAFSKGWNVAIATDPLFPRKAILHRLRWAGLAPEEYPFTLISDFHDFHFSKISITYYPEFLARMGWVDEPVLMIGDSLERDVIPSQKIGLPVFWLGNHDQATQAGVPGGDFAELKHFIESTDTSSLKENYSSPSALIHFLEATLAVMHTLWERTNAKERTRQPQPGEWSFLEIICHLRDVDNEVNLPRVETIIKEENALIPGQSTDQFAQERQYILQEQCTAFHEFSSARRRLVGVLSKISLGDWERQARHTFLGPTTLNELVEFMVDHDRLHIQQALQTLGK